MNIPGDAAPPSSAASFFASAPGSDRAGGERRWLTLLVRLATVLLAGLVLAGILLPPPAIAQSAAGCVPQTARDWMVTSNPLSQDVRPPDCATVLQSPPDFRWPDVISSGGYQLMLSYPDGRVRTLAATQNWLNWDEVLPAGNYSWTVTYAGGTASSLRRFTVDANSKPFLVPKMSAVLATVTGKPHPRSLPDAATLATMKSQRSGAVSALLSEVSGRAKNAVPSQGYTYDDAYTYSKLAQSALMACVYSGVDPYCSDAVRRVVNLASWDPSGSTSYLKTGGMDQAARYLTWTIGIGYDWLYPRLTAAQRELILATLNTRTAVMYNDIIGSRSRLARSPRDSHANQTLTVVSQLATLLAGDLAVAGNTWLPNALPLLLNTISPWGGDEGGFANASTQGNWDMGDTLPVLIGLSNATGIKLADKAWLRNWGRYFAYFTPPGMAGGTTVFGDGFEYNESEHQARYGKGYTYFAPSPLGRWHMSQLKAEDPTRIEYLMAPPADFSGNYPFPSGTPNALYLPSIGQAAMHSDLSAPGRTSVYFKSSPPPYGAYNHSHADQNSFVVNAGGQRLAIESGYYDDYKTAHWLNWYHTTKAKNAITYDGGLGQLFYEANDRMGYGRISGFTHTAAYDIVSGDATAAYGGALSKAQRSLVYLRPNLILVYDDLASATARQWEWNIHAINQMSSSSDRTATIQNGGQTMCVTMLAGPAMRFAQSNAFSANPSGSRPAQWHGRFYSTTRLPSTEFIALLDVGCTKPAASATKSDGVWTIPVGTTMVTIDNGGVTVGKPTTSSPPAPTPPATSKPFSGTPVAVPATFEAENFDLGGEGVAYHDIVKGNEGGQYRTADDVDIIASCDPEGGRYVVNNFGAGEWLNYTISVPTSGNYNVEVKSSNKYKTGAFHLEVDGVNVSGTISGLDTANWCGFKWFGKSVPLSAGVHVLKLYSEAPYFNVNQIRVSAAAATPSYAGIPYSGVPAAVPGSFEAENFDKGGQGVAYRDATAGNQGGVYRTGEDVDLVVSSDALGGGYVVNNFSTGEWLNYTINVARTGNYSVQLRGANSFTASVAFHIEVDGQRVTPSLLFPLTGGWTTYQWIGTPAFALSAGKHVLRVVADQQYFNLNALNVVAVP
ncbi:MAG TPA: carbohydrate-binding protein [Azospira sp.]|nr:carbohydrate-binding protein [Azospira sp.]